MDQEKKVIPRTKVNGIMSVPGSKSYAQRAIALSVLSKNKITLQQLTECDDVIAALDVIEKLGATIVREGQLVYIRGGFDQHADHSINCGEAGLSTRLFSAFSLLTEKDFKINGSGSILNRPMDMVVDALEQLGKKVESNERKLPLIISGKTEQVNLKIDGSTSSQLLTGLLIVAPFLPFDLTIDVTDLKSIPYIEMTINVINDFGLQVKHENFEKFYIKGGQSIAESIDYKVEGDWSGASFFIVASLIGGPLRLKGLNKESLQADRAILEVVHKVGGSYEWNAGELIIKGAQLNPFVFDATHCPDLFPPLVALAAMIEGESKIEGVHRLKHKESDRAAVLIQEFKRLSVEISEDKDALVVKGLKEGEVVNGGWIDSHNDHRIAMALSLMSLRAGNTILIKDPDSIKKSYPLFYEDFDQITA